MSMTKFTGIYQNNDTKIVDSDNHELAINPDGSIEVKTTPAKIIPLGYEQVTAGNTAVGLTVPADTELALIQNEGSGSGAQGVRWRDDGVDPTPTVGMLLDRGGEIEYAGDPTAMRFINTGGSADIINVSYYKFETPA